MADLLPRVISLLRAAWRRRWIGLAVAWLVAALGTVLVMRVQDRYEASARVYVDTKSVLKPLMRELAVELDLDRTIGLLARTLITRPNVERLLAAPGIDFDTATPVDRERTIELLMREIRVTGSGQDNVYTFVYRDTNPERGRRVVHNLVSLFIESDAGNKRRDTDAARAFIDEQIKGYEGRLAEAENRLKEFKLRNLGVTEASGKDYFARMSTLTEELSKQVLELRAAEQARDALKRELAGEDQMPALIPETPQLTSAVPSEVETRLQTQHKLLDDLLRRYTDQHPDVIATRRLITRLEEQKQQETEQRRRAAEAQPARVPSSVNPVFQQIKLALAEAEANVASLQVRVRDMQGRMGQLRAAVNRVPQVEAELAQLNRDYDIVKRNYEALVGRREKASISEDVDSSSRLAYFRVIEPPRTAPYPVFPNRQMLGLMVLLAAVGMGAAASFAAAQLVPTFNSARLLHSVTQRQVLGSVSMALTDANVRRMHRANLAFGTALCSLFVAYGAWLSWLVIATRA